jgi:hypothetical protein
VVASSTQLMYGSWQAKGKCRHDDASCRGLVEDIGNAAAATVASSDSGEGGETCSVA